MGKIDGPKPEIGQELYDVDEKLVEDYDAREGDRAYMFISTAPYEGSAGLTNLFVATRLLRKGFELTIVLHGPGVLIASGTRGYPAVGAEAFPGHMAANNQVRALLDEGARVLVDRFSLGALYGFREDDLIAGVTPINPLDVLDLQLEAWRGGSFRIDV